MGGEACREREKASIQLKKMLSEAETRINELRDHVIGRLEPISLDEISGPVDCGQDLEVWPPLFHELRASTLSILRAVDSIYEVVSRIEI
jgi:hypothetical protein